MFPSAYPANAVPQWADLVLGTFMPRVLILIYIYQNLGVENVWFMRHLVVAILAYFGGSRETCAKKKSEGVIRFGECDSGTGRYRPEAGVRYSKNEPEFHLWRSTTRLRGRN
jgi:hypothetical protein